MTVTVNTTIGVFVHNNVRGIKNYPNSFRLIHKDTKDTMTYYTRNVISTKVVFDEEEEPSMNLDSFAKED